MLASQGDELLMMLHSLLMWTLFLTKLYESGLLRRVLFDEMFFFFLHFVRHDLAAVFHQLAE